jgi:hypothetical protein
MVRLSSLLPRHLIKTANKPLALAQAIRFRRARQLVLPALPPALHCATGARSRRDTEQLGVPLGRQHAISFCCAPTPLRRPFVCALC